METLAPDSPSCRPPGRRLLPVVSLSPATDLRAESAGRRQRQTANPRRRTVERLVPHGSAHARRFAGDAGRSGTKRARRNDDLSGFVVEKKSSPLRLAALARVLARS